MQSPYPTNTPQYAGHDVANAHRTHAALHQQHAQAHHVQAQYHAQQAQLHAFRANQISNLPAYDERHTANAGVVSPAALVFRGEVSPQAVQSLQQFYNPFGAQNTGVVSRVPLSQHAAHATENQVAMQRGQRF
ncbi:MAG TPA: hypothetical protein VE710_16385 [Candidatus Bathyarchaeia archaeon]|nr:hypothetical protein [Candidatus Bathyarchaeia archaeon]